MTIDVVIPTWRGRDLLAGCLEHLSAQTVSAQVIVVDNASEDGTAELVSESFPKVRLISLPENRGFGAAVNEGVRSGDGDAVVLVNNDVELEPGALEALVAPLAHPRVGMVAGVTTIPDNGLVDGFGIELDVTLAAYNRLRRRSAEEEPGVLLGPSGGLAAYRRFAFEQAGGFDERLFAYGEDVDLALRLRALGWHATATRDARGVHLGGASVGVDSPCQRWLAGFARAFLVRRYGVLRSLHGPRALAIEALVIGAGILRGRTLAHVWGRVAGWRAARGERLPVPADAIDTRIDMREALRRLRHDR